MRLCSKHSAQNRAQQHVPHVIPLMCIVQAIDVADGDEKEKSLLGADAAPNAYQFALTSDEVHVDEVVEFDGDQEKSESSTRRTYACEIRYLILGGKGWRVGENVRYRSMMFDTYNTLQLRRMVSENLGARTYNFNEHSEGNYKRMENGQENCIEGESET